VDYICGQRIYLMKPNSTTTAPPLRFFLLFLRALVCYLGLVFIHEGLLREEYDSRAIEISRQAYIQARSGGEQAQARWSVEARNQLKDEIRRRGNPVTKAWAEQRNAAKYGDVLGPTYEALSVGMQKKGVVADSVAWEIIGGAGRTSREVSLAANNLLIYGTGLIIAYIIWLIILAVQTPPSQRGAVAVRELALVTIGNLIGMGLAYLVAAVYPF